MRGVEGIRGPGGAPAVGPGCGTLARVSETPTSPDARDDLEALVPEWLTVPDLVERLGRRLSDVRTLLEEREIIAVRRGERHVVSVPAGFVDDDGPLPALRGTFTVLADGGMDDAEIIRWLHTPDDTLPVPGTPLDAIRAGFKTEVRRRAMEEAF